MNKKFFIVLLLFFGTVSATVEEILQYILPETLQTIVGSVEFTQAIQQYKLMTQGADEFGFSSDVFSFLNRPMGFESEPYIQPKQKLLNRFGETIFENIEKSLPFLMPYLTAYGPVAFIAQGSCDNESLQQKALEHLKQELDALKEKK